MRYEFKNTKTGDVIVKNFPASEVPEKFEENGIVYIRCWSSNTIIPHHMKAGNY